MTAPRVPLRPATATGFRWDPATQRYRKPNGGFVSRVEVRRAVDTVVLKAEQRTRALAEQLRTGGLALEDWALAMRAEIKRQHLISAAAAKGGWANLSAADFGLVGQRLRLQYGYLDGFAAQIAAGLPLDGRFVTRAGMYEQAARSTFHAIERQSMRAAGFTEERNVLQPADHCEGCLDQTARGWVPIGALRPIGSRTCLTRCKCRLEYRREGDGGDA